MVRVITYVLLFVWQIINPSHCFAQEIPKTIPPSPDAVSLFRYQTYPVDYSTGLPQINIPLYEIKSGSLRVPLELSYHASGRRVDDQDGAISLGWTLNAGGTISRTVKGSADFGAYKFPYPFKTDGLTNKNDCAYLEQIVHYKLNPTEVFPSNWKDSEYDIFSYYFGNNSGKFIFKDINNVKTPILLTTSKPYVITPVYRAEDSPYGILERIDILDDKGVLYQFTPMGHYNGSDGSVIENEYCLTKIISADKADTISFTYTSVNQTRTRISHTITAIDKVNNGDQDIVGENSLFSTNYDFYAVPRLQQINFRHGKVVFNLVSGSDKIDNIQVFDSSNKPIKSIQFNRSRLDASSAGTSSNITNKLDNIVFKDATGSAIENYAFEYYPTAATSGVLNLHHRDWWGYYNVSGRDDMVPRYTNLEWVTSASISFDHSIGSTSANRTPKLTGLLSGVLKKITYPTGGSSEFVYQNNRYKHYSSSQVKDGPGIRIQQIKTNDRNGTTSYRTFVYGEDGNGYGTIDLVPDISNMAKESHYYYFMPNGDINPLNPYGNSSYRERVFYDDFIPQLKELATRPVTYKMVTEYLGTPEDNTGKIVYTYDYQPWTPQSFQNSRNELTIRGQHIVNYNYWNKPSLINRKEYKNIANNRPYQLVKETVNNYGTKITEKIYGLHIDRVNIFPQRAPAPDPDPDFSGKYVEPWAVLRTGSPTNLPYAFGKYQITAGYKYLSSSSETVYNEDGMSNSTLTSYIYNSRGYVSSVTSSASDGGSLGMQTKYPFDYSGNTVLSQMVRPETNMLNYPVEEIQLKNNVVINATKINYFNWGASVPQIYPQIIQTRTGSLPYETKIRFYDYDNFGNLLSVAKENGPTESYVWSYKNQYPVAKVLNANYNTIETLLGGATAVRTFSASIPPSANAVNDFLNPLRAEGLKDIQVTTFSYKPLVGMTSQTDAKGMTMYYEYDNYQRLISVKDHNRNVVKNYKYNYGSGVSSGVYFNSYVSQSYTKTNCTSGYGTSVTYRVPAKKYFSTISQADADAKAKADMQANGQNYANQHGECFYRNAKKQQTFTKDDCPVGVNGSKVTYTVPLGKYTSTMSQADADAMAQAEIDANGQANANANGACGFYNVAVHKIFTKNNCPAGEIPSEEVYKVPAKRYYSRISQETVDAMAQADIDANGQAYANTNGTCRQAVSFSFSNSTSDSFGVSFKDNYGVIKSYTCPPGYSSLVLPEGVYTITVQNISSNINRQIYVGARTAIVGTYVQFSNVNVFNVGFPSEKSMGMLN
ncbi:DUF5977 domain-containing protein [Sinomicrobium oceani]|uniref:DUF5977 domain-containing protein n=1 Tax=Sinomicrobium oceani TaxID=1150368 RepID=UPI001114E668|nr:DUF5977 domain-containing protein [Sinomicrobium oceani]